MNIMNMNKKPAAGLTLDEPSVTELEHWKAYTDGNQHTAVRIAICEWLAKNLTRNGIDEVHETVAIHKTLTALEVVNRELGHMPGELSELSSRTTHRMLALAGRYSPKVAETIRKAL